MNITFVQMLRLASCLALSSFLAFSPIASNGQQPSPNPDAFYTIDDFSKLLTSHADPYNTKNGEAIAAQNVRANEQFGALAKRTALNLLGTCSHTSAVTGLARYYKADATKYTVTTSDTYLDYISDTGTCTNLNANITTGKRWSFITYKNLLVGTNGYDAPVKWDGKLTTTADTVAARTAGDLVTSLGAPFAEIYSGTGLTASKWYQYRIAYYDGTTYKYSTARSNPLLLGTTNKQINLTDIPLGPTGTTSRIIYRTTGLNTRALAVASSTFYKVASIGDNTTTTYTDSASDATISADAAPTWATVSAGTNVTPPKGVYMFIHKDYIWLGNDPSGTQYGKSTVYFSVLTNADYWKPTDYFLVRPDDGDEVVGLTSFLGNLIIPKTNTISKIYTDSATTSTWQVSQPFSFVGSAAPQSIRSTPLGVFYLGRYGLYKFDGQSSSLISDVVTKDIKDINPTNYANISAIYYNNEYRLAYTSTATGAAANDRVLVFDVVRNSYTKDTENVNVWSIFNGSDDFGALYSGSSGTDGKILAHSTQPTDLLYRYQSELDTGTYTGTYAGGTETDPTLSLGWSVNWAYVPGIWSGQGSATWGVSQSPGYWYSPIVQVNASALSKVYWNQVLGSSGTASVAIRTGASSAAVSAAAWSSEFTTSSGSDVSAVTANSYVQLRVKLSTSDFTADSPYLYTQDNFLLKLVYSKTGSSAETEILSIWNSGWMDFASGQSSITNGPKIIKEIDVYYEGTSGSLTFTINNLKGDVVSTFTIDLSKNRLASTNYWGSGSYKVFRWLPSMPGTQSNYLYGDRYMVTVTENGTTPWKIQRIIFRYEPQPFKPYT